MIKKISVFSLITILFHLNAAVPPILHSSHEQKQRMELKTVLPMTSSKVLYQIRDNTTMGCTHIYGYPQSIINEIALEKSRSRGSEYIDVEVWRRDSPLVSSPKQPSTNPDLFPLTIVRNVPLTMTLRTFGIKVKARTLFAPMIKTTPAEEKIFDELYTRHPIEFIAAAVREVTKQIIKSRLLESNQLDLEKTFGQLLEEERLTTCAEYSKAPYAVDCLSTDENIPWIKMRVDLHDFKEEDWCLHFHGPVTTKIKDVCKELGISFLFSTLDVGPWYSMFSSNQEACKTYWFNRHNHIRDQILAPDFDMQKLANHLNPKKTVKELMDEKVIAEDPRFKTVTLDGLYHKPLTAVPDAHTALAQKIT